MAKGGNYENDRSKDFSLWLTEGKRDDFFGRTDTSGGRATTRRQKKQSVPNHLFGDMTYRHPLGQPLIDTFLFEFKHGYKDNPPCILSLVDFIKNRKRDQKLIEWWRKAEEDRVAGKREYIWLVFRRHGKEDSIAMNKSFFAKACEYAGEKQDWKCIVQVETCGFAIVVLNFKEFLEWFNPASFYVMFGYDPPTRIRRRPK